MFSDAFDLHYSIGILRLREGLQVSNPILAAFGGKYFEKVIKLSFHLLLICCIFHFSNISPFVELLNDHVRSSLQLRLISSVAITKHLWIFSYNYGIKLCFVSGWFERFAVCTKQGFSWMLFILPFSCFPGQQHIESCEWKGEYHISAEYWNSSDWFGWVWHRLMNFVGKQAHSKWNLIEAREIIFS